MGRLQDRGRLGVVEPGNDGRHVDADGNASLGEALDCLKCDRLEWPEGLASYRRTPEFDQDSVPAGLRKDHATKRGVWGRIEILAGALDYVVQPPVDATFVLDPETPGIVAPEVPHHVSPRGVVRFFVEFHRRSEGERS